MNGKIPGQNTLNKDGLDNGIVYIVLSNVAGYLQALYVAFN